MSDDERLAALFRDAASEPPPAAFGHDDVVEASRRLTARRRTAVVATVAVVGLVGLGAGIVLPQQFGTAAVNSAAAPVDAPAAAGEAAAGSAPDSAGGAPVAPASDAAGGSPGAGSVDRSGSPLVAPGCADRHDAGLRALVARVLPEVATAPDAPTTDVCLLPTERYLAVELDGGVLTASYFPPGTVPSLVPGALSAPAASGGTVIVSGPDALADRLPAVLDVLAPQL
jgi:hypothetical protein